MGVFDVASDLQWSTSQAFRAAEWNRLNADRWLQTNHPDTEIQYALRQLRASSRDLVRNNPYAAGMVETIADNVTGWEGMQLRPTMGTAAGDALPREVKWEVQAAWEDWCDDHATVDGMESWLETERLIDKAWATDGEVFIRLRKGWDNPHAFAVEIIDPDLLDEDFNEPRDRSKSGNEIVMGVEIDEHGRPVAYHFWKEHPDEMGFRRERARVPAEEIVHWFVRYRPGQHRGFPLLTPAITTFEMADGYTQAELVAARSAASKMGFITNNDPEAVQAYATRLAMQSAQGKGEVRRRMKVAPGIIDELAPGQGFQDFDPTHPSDSFDPFLKVIMRGVSRAAGMSYMALTGDLADANYSNQRAGLIPERDHWKALQNVKKRRVHRPVHGGWRSMALLSGTLNIPPAYRDYRARFWGRRWPWVDPKNDGEADEMAVKLGINSRQRLAADRGHDFETIIDESAEDMSYAKESGVYVGGMGTPPVKRADADTNGSSGNGNGNGASASSRLVPYEDVRR